mmetsp:Transcript_4038/g.11513  ORF Transcript_4038/g.11513 Transcript_4038/m.11513 type:complete len:226 (-) Transcript_4038:430-1107(-)
MSATAASLAFILLSSSVIAPLRACELIDRTCAMTESRFSKKNSSSPSLSPSSPFLLDSTSGSGGIGNASAAVDGGSAFASLVSVGTFSLDSNSALPFSPSCSSCCCNCSSTLAKAAAAPLCPRGLFTAQDHTVPPTASATRAKPSFSRSSCPALTPASLQSASTYSYPRSRHHKTRRLYSPSAALVVLSGTGPMVTATKRRSRSPAWLDASAAECTEANASRGAA